ncbi:MAG: PQQ-binding-like beta-propeller repeat protein [Acidobacteriota bacterium]|jgi:outer membrane protein assembly factor BamB
MTRRRIVGALALVFLAATAALSPAGDWPSWRGPHRNGLSDESDLISSWSRDGENLIWKAELTTRATPIVFDGRACVSGRVGRELLMQELVACFDAGTGEKLWERRFPVYNTTVPFTRVGWASLAGDPETGYVYAQNVDGHFLAFDRNGEIVWQRRLGEEFGRASGFGGRTLVPIVDGDRVIIGIVGAGWGDNAAPRQRYMAFDKRTGTVLWVSTPGQVMFKDANNNGSPTVGTIDGRRVVVGAGADGWVHAVDAGTGEPLWRFELSLRGLQVPVLVRGDTVYAAHSEENVDAPGLMGRVVALDGTGRGDITKTGEIWRTNGLGVGFAAPTAVDGRLYVLGNSADVHALDLRTGAPLWSRNIGNIGRAAITSADGKLFATEQNGHVFILEPGPDGAEVLDKEYIEMPEGRFAEIWGSVAIAYGRLYFTAEDGLYCLGKKDALFEAAPSPAEAGPELAPAGATPAAMRVVPAEVIGVAGEPVHFEAWLYDDMGRFIRKETAEWTLDGLAGSISADGTLTSPLATTAGHVKGAVGELTHAAQVRLFGPLPWGFDFEDGKVPRHWIGAGRFDVADLGGSQRFHKPPVTRGLSRSSVFIGPADMKGYTVEADLLATRQGRRMPDMGVINQGYTLDVMGRHQRLQIRTWAAHLEKSVSMPFTVEPNTWYRAKLRVDVDGARGTVRGKVWKKGEPEPGEWSITYEDPIVVQEGSPGLYGDSPIDIYYDNVTVKVNE